MAMIVKNNMSAISTLNTLNKNSSALSKSLQKVSSGMKINSAADDASGYAISERMRVQIRSLDQANDNTQNGSSMMKVAEGAVSSTVDILKTLKEKAINAANDSNTDSDRQTIQKELDQSIDQINDNANVTFNGKYLIDGSKNSKGNATYTVLTNQSLSTDTTAATKLTDLKARSGDSLEIVDTDSVTVSYVQAGVTYSTTFSAKDATVGNIFGYAEMANDSDTIFASGDNKSVTGADSTAASASTAAGKAALNALTGAETTTASTLNGIVDAAAGGTAKAMADAVVDGVAIDIAKYNAAQTDDSKKIDTTALSAYMTENTTAANSKITANMTNSTKAAFMQALTSDANYADFLAAAKADTTTYAGGAVAADTAYTNYKQDVVDYYTDKTAVLTGDEVGLNASGDLVTTASGENGISITANGSGIKGQISGFTISVADSDGNIKKSANASLDAFDETIRAQNKSEDNAITLQVGTKANQSIKVGLTDMRAEALGLKGADGTTLNISTQAKANAAINVLDNAIQKALDQQTTIGAVESRLEYTSSNLTTASENVQSSESTIRDADMAKEMTEYTKNNVLLQAAQSMLAQANQNSSSVLSLLQ